MERGDVKEQYCKTGNPGHTGQTHLGSRGVQVLLRRDAGHFSYLGACQAMAMSSSEKQYPTCYFSEGFYRDDLEPSLKRSLRSSLESPSPLKSVGHPPTPQASPTPPRHLSLSILPSLSHLTRRLSRSPPSVPSPPASHSHSHRCWSQFLLGLLASFWFPVII